MSMEVQKAVHAEFRRHGLSLRRDSVKLVAAYVDDQHVSVEDAAELMLNALEKQELKSTILDVETVEKLIGDLLEGVVQDDSATHVIGAFDMPKFNYDPIKKAFYKVSTKPDMFGDANAKISLYQERLMILRNRVSRNKLFAKPSFELSSSRREYCELTSVQGLMGLYGETKYLLGVLTEIEDGNLFIEDMTGTIKVEMVNAIPTTGLFTENCIIIAEGQLREDGVFALSYMGFPMLESRLDFRAATGNENFFGGANIRIEDFAQLEDQERTAEADMFVILSDVWLDIPNTFTRLRSVFHGFSSVEVVPSLFVFMGDYSSQPHHIIQTDYSIMKGHFDALAELICEFPRLTEGSQFVFMPGPNDPSPSPALPRPPLPMSLTTALSDRIPRAQFTSNPCRIRYYTQEIVLMREALQHRMMRFARRPPVTEETDSMFEHLATTLIQQGHLCPLPISVQPIYWEYDYALRLYSPPHALVLADFTEQASFAYKDADCNCFNPGSFGDKGVFAAYRPAARAVEMCSV
uniref:DNA polymerase epsilon subunit n=1 Tax=Pyramimonas obovata TaxID=1411642 RepID=A0A7S0MZV0_9CHLO|mmetsp:Transcript_17373/g.37809  ORF Transcript_17373/g.37809 Transcript_17373/m.37809 type:complete len:522 (+) Transcript_17373:365-1930(+)